MFKLTLNPTLSWRVEGKGPEVFIKVLGEKIWKIGRRGGVCAYNNTKFENSKCLNMF